MKLLLHDVYMFQPCSRTLSPRQSADLKVLPTLLGSWNTSTTNYSTYSNKITSIRILK